MRNPIEREFLTGLQKAKTTDDVRHLEAKAAQLWWGQWEGFRMSFKGAGVPAEWRICSKFANQCESGSFEAT